MFPTRRNFARQKLWWIKQSANFVKSISTDLNIFYIKMSKNFFCNKRLKLNKKIQYIRNKSSYLEFAGLTLLEDWNINFYGNKFWQIENQNKEISSFKVTGGFWWESAKPAKLIHSSSAINSQNSHPIFSKFIIF